MLSNIHIEEKCCTIINNPKVTRTVVGQSSKVVHQSLMLIGQSSMVVDQSLMLTGQSALVVRRSLMLIGQIDQIVEEIEYNSVRSSGSLQHALFFP